MLIPKQKYKFPAKLTISDVKVDYISADRGGFAIIHGSKQMGGAMKSVFDLAYGESKRLSRRK